MAIVDIKVPSPGESISEVRIARWLVKDGDVVNKDQVLAEIDSDKATLELSAEAEGRVQLLAGEDQTVNVGDVVVRIDTSVKAEKSASAKASADGKAKVQEQVQEAKKPASGPAPAPAPAPAAHATPVAQKMMEEKGIAPGAVEQVGDHAGGGALAAGAGDADAHGRCVE